MQNQLISTRTSVINLSLYGSEENVERVTGRFASDFGTKQHATYTIENGVATITALSPVIKTVISLPLPFSVPVNDLGTGLLVNVAIDCDTMKAERSICPKPSWENRRAAAPSFPGPRTEAYLTGSLI